MCEQVPVKIVFLSKNFDRAIRKKWKKKQIERWLIENFYLSKFSISEQTNPTKSSSVRFQWNFSSKILIFTYNLTQNFQIKLSSFTTKIWPMGCAECRRLVLSLSEFTLVGRLLKETWGQPLKAIKTNMRLVYFWKKIISQPKIVFYII